MSGSTVTLLPALIDALVTLYSSQTGVLAIDGPGATDDPAPLVVFIGLADPDGDTISESASTSIVWPWLGHVSFDETVTIHCSAVAWSGDTDTAAMKRERDAAFGLLKVATDAVRADPSLGLMAAGVLNLTDISRIALYQVQDEQGTRADVRFDLTFHARF